METVDGAPLGVGSACSEHLVVPAGASVLLGLADGRAISLTAVP